MTETSKDAEKYISCSMINIDEYIHKRQFRQAFGLLILFLERLDGEEKAAVVDYYSKNMFELGIFVIFDNTDFINTML